MAKRQPDDYIKRRDVIRTMHEKRPSWGDSNYNFIRDIPSADVYTKADMVAMLEEIKLKITEKSYYDTTIIGNYEDEVRIDLVELDDVNDIIQEKINTLEVEDENK